MAKRSVVELELQAKRGGRRQRAEAVSALQDSLNREEETSYLDSLFAKDLVGRWSTGAVSAAEVLIEFKTNLKRI